MSTIRYLYLIDLDNDRSGKSICPETLPELDEAHITAYGGKCATIEMPNGVLYIAGKSRCSPKLWQDATGSTENWPQAPWAAYRGFDQDTASGLAWGWLSRKPL